MAERESGHLVPPAWLQANGFTPESWQRFSADLAADFERACRTGHVKLLDPLPWRTRLRLWITGRISRLGCWLVKHGHCAAAVALWRACRMW